MFTFLKKQPAPHTSILLFGLFGALTYMVSPTIGALCFGIAGMLFFVQYQIAGLVLMALTAPLLGAILDLSQAEWARQTLLRSINAPIGDIIAVLVLIAVLLHLYLFGKMKHIWNVLVREKWMLVWFSLFIGIGIVSALGAYEYNSLSSFKFLFRSIVFSIGVFYLFAQLIIDDLFTLHAVVRITAWVGFLAALFGIGSLVFAPIEGFPRITAYALKGFAPFGYNHNVLAEFLVVAVPAALYAGAASKYTEVKSLYRGMAVFIAIVALATLSRAAWLVIGFMGVLLAYNYKEQTAEYLRQKRSVVIVSLLGVLIVTAFAIFLQTSTVSSSNSNRLLTTEVVMYYSGERPLLGYGPGMYTRILGETRAYTVDFGTALDAHGMFQKVLLEMGYLGFIAFVGLLSTIIWSMTRMVRFLHGDNRYLGLMLYAMGMSQMIYQLFNTSYFTAHMWWPLGIATAGLYILVQKQLHYGNFIKKK